MTCKQVGLKLFVLREGGEPNNSICSEPKVAKQWKGSRFTFHRLDSSWIRSEWWNSDGNHTSTSEICFPGKCWPKRVKGVDHWVLEEEEWDSESLSTPQAMRWYMSIWLGAHKTRRGQRVLAPHLWHSQVQYASAKHKLPPEMGRGRKRERASRSDKEQMGRASECCPQSLFLLLIPALVVTLRFSIVQLFLACCGSFAVQLCSGCRHFRQCIIAVAAEVANLASLFWDCPWLIIRAQALDDLSLEHARSTQKTLVRTRGARRRQQL